jgi:hypothetical protein
VSTQTQNRLQPWVVPDTEPGWSVAPKSLAALADDYEAINLEQMEDVALLDRTDTKFVLSSGQLRQALAALQQDYWMLSVEGKRLNHYRTLYFDSPGFELYLLHVNGRADRYKVRSREYTDTHLSYLEVKHRTPKDRTIKERLCTARPVTWMTAEAEEWLQEVYPYDSQALEPKLWNTFTRLTLVSKQRCERVTLDIDLAFYTGARMSHLDNIAIAEVKMERGHCLSPFMRQMHAQKVHPCGFSKYCIGVGLLYDGVKKNALKPKLLWLDMMTRGAATYE